MKARNETLALGPHGKVDDDQARGKQQSVSNRSEKHIVDWQPLTDKIAISECPKLAPYNVLGEHLHYSNRAKQRLCPFLKERVG